MNSEVVQMKYTKCKKCGYSLGYDLLFEELRCENNKCDYVVEMDADEYFSGFSKDQNKRLVELEFNEEKEYIINPGWCIEYLEGSDTFISHTISYINKEIDWELDKLSYDAVYHIIESKKENQ